MNARRWKVWGWPIVVGVVTLVGLIAALLADGVWDVLSAFALGVPTLLCAWFAFVPRKAATKARDEAP